MITFTFLDGLWLVLFLVLMIGSGMLFYRLGKRSESDFFLAGRGLPLRGQHRAPLPHARSRG